MSSLSAASLDHARALLRQFPLIDGHNDLPWVVHSTKTAGMSLKNYDLSRLHPETDTDTPRLKEGQVAAQFFAAFVPTLADKPGRMTLELIDMIRQIPEAWPETYAFATSVAEIKRAFRSGKIAVLATVEGGTGLENSLAPLRVWHAAGVRLMTLCHNETLDWVDSATDAPRHEGLTKFGEAVVLELNRLGIIVDLAHTAPRVMHRVLDISRAPVLFSHNNATTLCDHPRNAPDDVLDRIRAKKSVIMATFVPDFISQKARDWARPLKDNYGKSSFLENHEARVAAYIAEAGPQPKATISELCDHIEYLTSRTGLNHIGIGSDYFGGTTPEGLEDVSKFPYLIAALIDRGWSDPALEKLCGGNILRLMKSVERLGEVLRATEPPRTGRIEDYDPVPRAGT
jgi:membrane dipeptidase